MYNAATIILPITVIKNPINNINSGNNGLGQTKSPICRASVNILPKNDSNKKSKNAISTPIISHRDVLPRSCRFVGIFGAMACAIAFFQKVFGSSIVMREKR